jgi:hypothetical protein
MNESKPWYASTAVWGGVLAALSPLIALAGYEVDAGQAADLLAALGSLVGGALAVYGRVRATAVIARQR